MVKGDFNEPFRVFQLMSSYPGTWGIAGGWAIDLFINEVTRSHQDIEIAIPRSEQLMIQAYISDWELRYVIDGQFYDWEQNQHLTLPIHEIHGTDGDGSSLEILLNETDDTTWYFRRNTLIHYPRYDTFITSPSGIPILAPECVLLYKAKWCETKDNHDLKYALPYLNEDQKIWLASAIEMNHGSHHWLKVIQCK